VRPWTSQETLTPTPQKVKAGLDLPAPKRDLGKALCLMGGIDAPGVSGPPQAVEEDLGEKLALANRGGGYILHSDRAGPETVIHVAAQRPELRATSLSTLTSCRGRCLM
jgi:hypothetical protein